MTTSPVRTQPTATPTSALAAARLGGSVALVAAASISFTALCDLAHHAGLHDLAALLPIAVDAFAATTLFVAYRLPRGHHAHRAAGRSARLALALTVGCNGLDHLLDLAGYLLTPRVRDLLLVVVASLPPLIVERLLHLQTALVDERGTGSGNGHDDAETRLSRSASETSAGTFGPELDVADSSMTGRADDVSSETGQIPMTGHPDNVQPKTHRPADDQWLTLAVPVYDDLVARLGRRPSEAVFYAALTEVLTRQNGNLTGHGSRVTGPGRPVRTVSLSTAKRVRALVEANRKHQAA